MQLHGKKIKHAETIPKNKPLIRAVINNQQKKCNLFEKEIDFLPNQLARGLGRGMFNRGIVREAMKQKGVGKNLINN